MCVSPLPLSLSHTHHTSLHLYTCIILFWTVWCYLFFWNVYHVLTIYIYIYIYVCVCVFLFVLGPLTLRHIHIFSSNSYFRDVKIPEVQVENMVYVYVCICVPRSPSPPYTPFFFPFFWSLSSAILLLIKQLLLLFSSSSTTTFTNKPVTSA